MHEAVRRSGLWGLVITVGLSVSACRSQGRSTPPSDAGFELTENQLRPCADVVICEANCRDGLASDCLGAGNGYATGVGAPRDERRAADLFVRACELGNGPGCTFGGRMYEFAHGVDRDVAKALSLYGRACKLDYLGGCYNVAVLLENGRGVARDAARAAALYRKTCAAGSLVSCAAASRLEAQLPDGGTP